MHKQIALAYAIAGIAVAIALVVTVGGRQAPELEPGAPAVESTPPPDNTGSTGDTGNTGSSSGTLGSSVVTGDVPVEYVYVDAPTKTRRGHREENGDDDDEESDEGQAHPHRERD